MKKYISPNCMKNNFKNNNKIPCTVSEVKIYFQP